VFFAGFEGQYFCSDWTLSAKAGYMDSDESSLLSNAGFIQAGASYYSSKKLKLTGSLAYIDGELVIDSATADVEEWAWSLGAEYWFGETMPVSGFVEYRGRSAEGSLSTDSADLDENTINAGVKFHFGGDGFQDADRKGASTELPDLNWYRLIPGSGISP
jgi:long-subunit fatty acid transport protein